MSSKNYQPEDFSKYLLRDKDEQGEFFTVKKTGLSGMSQSGLGTLVGKTQSSISEWVNKVRKADPMGNSLPECLKPFAGKQLTLMGYSDQAGRDILEDRFCAALVEYYAYCSKDAPNNHQAKKAFALIRDIGMRQFIHIKTGWHPEGSNNELENLLESHQERVNARTKLKDKERPNLMNAVAKYQIQKKGKVYSRKLFSKTHQEINKVIQAVTSEEIKLSNGLPKSALIRDYFDTESLIDYGCVSRVAANLIHCGSDPLEAVHLAVTLYFSPEYVPQEIPLVENIHKVTKLLESKQLERQQSLLEFDPNSKPKAS